MILLPIILTPLGIAILLIVMSWTERALDVDTRPAPTQPMSILPAAALAPAIEASAP